MARVFLGAVMTRTPSEERLEATSSCLVLSTPSLTLTLSSSGLYWLVSRLTSSLLSSSLTRITSVSLLLKMSVLLEKSELRAGSIQRRGNIHPFSHLDLESCLIRDLGAEVCSSAVIAPPAGDSSMMLLDMQAMFRKSSSNFFHMSLDSVNMASLTLSKSSQEFLKKGSSKKKSLIVTGTLDPDILMFVLCSCDMCVLKVCLPFTPH